MDLCWPSNVSAFYYAVYDGHNFSSKEQASFNFMAAVTICSDFGTSKNKECFPPNIESRAMMCSLTTLFDILPEILACVIA